MPGRAMRLATSTEAAMEARYGRNLAAYRRARGEMGARLGREAADRFARGEAPMDVINWQNEAIRAAEADLDARFAVAR